MLRLFLVTFSILYSSLTLAQSNYQVDLVLFAHPQSGDANNSLAMTSPLLPISQNAITLQPNSSKPYGLMPNSKSSLRDQYYLLSRKSNYRVLGQYSWIQPGANQSSVTLPKINHNGWQIQGTLRVRQNNYYLFDAHLQASSPNNPDAYFTINQDQRLKGGVVYFLDHPQIGMLVKIHKLA